MSGRGFGEDVGGGGVADDAGYKVFAQACGGGNGRERGGCAQRYGFGDVEGVERPERDEFILILCRWFC